MKNLFHVSIVYLARTCALNALVKIFIAVVKIIGHPDAHGKTD